MDNKKLKPTSLIENTSCFTLNELPFISINTKKQYNQNLGTDQQLTTKFLQGGHMRIKFDRLETLQTNPNPSGKTYSMTRVVGEALEGKLVGQEWSTKFFPSNKDLQSVAKQAVKGDILDITMKKQGNYLNPVTMEICDPDSLPVATSSGMAVGVIPINKASDRRDNLAVAISIMGPKKTKDEPVDYIMDAAGVADLVGDYATESGPFQFDPETSKNGIPDVDDAVEVKDVEVK